GQTAAGAVPEHRPIQFAGRDIEAPPPPPHRPPNYSPGGRVAGRPVPAGWYSEPWWQSALRTGAWTMGSVLLFDAMFSGMHGVGYGASGFESGYGSGFDQGYDAGFDQGMDAAGGDYGGGDFGGGGGDFGGGGGDFGGGDFGGFDF
ncbi:MAG: DUF1542 domain-containing protein, partial [Mycobacterium sp.]